MKILVTGAFGGIGTEVIKQGYKKGHQISIFELNTPNNQKKAELYKDITYKLFWGDLRNYEDIYKAIKEQDAVIHLAAIVPPFSEKNTTFSDSVNIGGTKNIIKAINNSDSITGLIFTSSMSIMGADSSRKPPLKITDPVYESSNYTREKIECEKILNSSDIHWTIARLGAVINTDFSVGGGSIGQILDEVFSMSLDNRIESVWNIDVATALINASQLLITNPKSVDKKTFFIGGGNEKGWQMTVKDLYKGVFDAIGFGLPKDSNFNTEPYYADWLDTQESQKLFNYQNHSYKDYIIAVKKKLGFKRIIIRFFAPLLRGIMITKSKYRKKKCLIPH